MSVFAANTWGISGQNFLGLYVAVALATYFGCVGVRHWLLRGKRKVSLGACGNCELAMINGGENLLVASVVAELTHHGELVADGKDKLRRAQAGIRGRKLGAQERMVMDCVPADHPITMAALTAGVRGRPELGELRRRLERAGVLPSRRSARVVRMLVLTAVPVIGLGVARVIAGAHNHKPVTDLIWVIAIYTIAMVLFARPRPYTRFGIQTLSDGRRRHTSYRNAPSLGPGLAVALFGTGVLWSLDAGVATAMGASHAVSSGGGWSGWSGGGSGCGSSCGGGGCGGGAGCGGGGCGGGGCGG